MNLGNSFGCLSGGSDLSLYGEVDHQEPVLIYDRDRQQALSGKVFRTTSGALFRCKPGDLDKIESRMHCSECSEHNRHIVEGRPLNHRVIINSAILDARPKDESIIESLKGYTLAADIQCFKKADPINFQKYDEHVELTAFSRRVIVYCAKAHDGDECLQAVELSDLPEHFHGEKHRCFPPPAVAPQGLYPTEDLMTFDNLPERAAGSGDEQSMVQMQLMSGMKILEHLQKTNEEQAEQIIQLNKTIEQLQSSVGNLSVTCADSKIQIKELQEQRTDGTFLWRIDNFREAIDKASIDIETSFDSPVFYSAPEGYRMKATIFPYGDGKGKGTHISLFISIMKGMYDEILTWPFDQTLSFEIVGEGKEVLGVNRSEPDRTIPSFQKPESMNRGIGCDKFMAIDDLTHMLPGGSLFIRVNVGEKASGS
ncbi:hypothetical protein [Endozoicomonas acroporae]|uniref:hypothetical protein n=1 Tax=Endozoicomonas acroporae TaxID=1701104 RepID=UPI0013D1189F|nr:hypothetical protein [Endozoicomonas acroporae]